jgi:hypothetical protein
MLDPSHGSFQIFRNGLRTSVSVMTNVVGVIAYVKPARLAAGFLVEPGSEGVLFNFARL